MRKVFCVLLFALICLMCGCSSPAFALYEKDTIEIFEDDNVETLKSWSFQFNEETNDYSLFFGLLNKNNEYVSAEVDVDIRIINEENEEVYKGTKSISKNNFNYYTSQVSGE